MATLTAFAPGLAVGAVWTSPEVSTTPVLQTIAAAVDTRYGEDAANNTHTLVQPYTLTGWPSDLVGLLTLSFDIRYFWGTAPDGDVTWNTLTVRIMSGTTVVAGGSAGGAFQTVASSITTTTPTNLGSTAFTYVNTGISKAELDAAQVEIEIDTTKSKGGDTAGRRVSAFEVSGTYDIPEAKTDVPTRHNSSTAKTVTAALAQDQWGKYVVPQIPWINPVKRSYGMVIGGEGDDCEFSPDGRFLAAVHGTSPYVTVYERSGSTFNQLSALTAPEGIGIDCAWSSDGRFLAVTHATSPYVTVYQHDGDGTFTKVPALTAPSITVVPGGCAFSSDGRFLAVGGDVTPYITVYERSGATGTTFTKVSALTAPFSGAVEGCDFSPDGRFLAVAGAATPYVAVYERDGTTFTELSALGTLSGLGNDCAFSPDGRFLAVAGDFTPYVTVYERDGTTFTKVSALAALPSLGNDCDWSPDGQFLALAHATTPFITVYERSGTTFTKLANPASLPAGTGSGCAFSPDGRFLAEAHATSPYIMVYETSGLNPREGYLWMLDPGER